VRDCTLHQKEPHQPASSCTERGSHGELALARAGPGQEIPARFVQPTNSTAPAAQKIVNRIDRTLVTISSVIGTMVRPTYPSGASGNCRCKFCRIEFRSFGMRLLRCHARLQSFQTCAENSLSCAHCVADGLRLHGTRMSVSRFGSAKLAGRTPTICRDSPFTLPDRPTNWDLSRNAAPKLRS